MQLQAINNAGLPVDYVWTDSNGVKHTNTFEIKEGDAAFDLNTPGNSVKGNYTWKNEWYLDSAGKSLGDISTIANGIQKTIYGKWVSTITFNINGAGNSIANKEVIKGQQMTSANLPNATGGNYTFRGWFADNNTFKTQIQTTYVPTGNQTIYCKWVSIITYNNNGAGSKPGNREVIKGQQITAAGLPSLSSAYTWKGWCATNPTNVSASVLQANWVPTGNITIYAKWVSIIYIDLDVEITSDNGVLGMKTDFTGEKSYDVIKGQKFNPGFNLTKYGLYVQNQNTSVSLTSKNEWATGHDGTGTRIAVNGTYTPTGNLTIYPIWYATVKFMHAYSKIATYIECGFYSSSTGWSDVSYRYGDIVPFGDVNGDVFTEKTVIRNGIVQGIDAFPWEDGDSWYFWYDDYTIYYNRYNQKQKIYVASGNKLASWNGTFKVTHNISVYPGVN